MYIAAVPLDCVHLYCGIAALAALPLFIGGIAALKWRHCRFHVLTLPFRVQTTACKQLLILVHLSLMSNISKTIYRYYHVRAFHGVDAFAVLLAARLTAKSREHSLCYLHRLTLL